MVELSDEDGFMLEASRWLLVTSVVFTLLSVCLFDAEFYDRRSCCFFMAFLALFLAIFSFCGTLSALFGIIGLGLVPQYPDAVVLLFVSFIQVIMTSCLANIDRL